MKYPMTNISTIFSKPGENIHKHYCSVTVADIAMTSIIAIVIAHLTKNLFLVFVV
jgi:hypothetical protein